MSKRIVIVCVFLLGICLAGKAATMARDTLDSLPSDTSFVKSKKVAADFFTSYQNNRDFEYNQANKPVYTGFWDRLFFQIANVLKRLFSHPWVPNILIVFIFIAFAFLMILLFAGDFQSLFSRNKASNGHIEAFTEDNLIETDFDVLMTAELSKGNINLAVRYLYLKLLQVLSRKQYIDWQKDKTNRQYIHEVSQQPFCPDFKSVTRAYEYVWYGKFQITNQKFGDLRHQVDLLIQKVNG